MKLRFALCTGFLLIFCLSETYGQEKLYIKQNNLSQTTITVSEIRKITFSPGNIIFEQTDLTNQKIDLDSIRILSFINYNTGIPIIKNDSFQIYPNPTDAHINIRFESNENTFASIEIINLQGQIILIKNMQLKKGVNSASIDLSELKNGIYICRMITNKKSVIQKIVKN